ncbi:uncharacterized protein LOC129768977 isoform X2 [Toxorhynchites rutilus septentrionalis]|uniref:uncharacterized protein LOC129768977 isoform X2 n=1 Tax=Toxorhynchites rutilus septentrionalis TaxID=329112 RepID=UPI00247B1AE9|nr:uncharacterized protein LOC129768977 isoform X2 [Toxorhynchites rutilus septentrionalis]XP_055626911.1 uncharacterized protein LOC129768977 isoform X2 [Toxorhynchites rutilus septentrionalis]XP_055626912.1 uncharacterized protein LOC129768977 isoform X2 [Toxorhynchites rutilus septentrionalis]
MFRAARREWTIRRKLNLALNLLRNKPRAFTPRRVKMFPKKEEKKRYDLWLARLRLVYEPSPTTNVCSSHFSSDNFVPPSRRRITKRVILKNTAVPDINLPQPKTDPRKEKIAKKRAERVARRSEIKLEDNHNKGFGTDIIETVELVEAAVQVNTLDWDTLFLNRRRKTAVRFKTDSELNCWTGLTSLKMLNTIVEGLCSLAAYKKRSRPIICAEEEVLVVFTKMKTNISVRCLGTLFNLHYQTVSAVIHRTVPLLKMMCTALIPWPTQGEIHRNMPHFFRPDFTDVVAVLDCMEIPIKKPKCLHCRINAYSHCKGHETAKYLITVTPGGTISYVSRGYGGRASENQIVVEENMLGKFRMGEALMADDRFSIESECAPYGVKLVRPPFLTARRYQFNGKDAREGVSIAAAYTLYVKRAMQRIKMFEIFNNEIDPRFLPFLDDMIYIVCGIVNISKPFLLNMRL